MNDLEARDLVANEIAVSIDELVKDLYSELKHGSSLIQEPEISSRLCQRLEDSMNGKSIGPYGVRVTSQSLPDRGPQSFEKVIGADIFLSLSIDGVGGFDKGLLVKSKYDRSVDLDELKTSCKKMAAKIGKKGNYVWVYTPSGVKVYSYAQIYGASGNDLSNLKPRSLASHFGRMIDCYAGNKKWGIKPGQDRRAATAEMLVEAKTKNGLDIALTTES